MKHNELIEKQLKKDLISQSVSKLKSYYSEFDNEKISLTELKNKLSNEKLAVWNDKTEKFLLKPVSKEKTFNNFIKSLNFYEHNSNYYPEFSVKNYKPIINENRIKEKNRIIWPRANPQNEEISTSVKKVLTRAMSVDDFKTNLSSKNIEIENTKVKRIIVDLEKGVDLSYTNTMKNILRYKDKPENTSFCIDKISKIKPIIATKQTTNESLSIAKKKQISSKIFTSDKTHFDWEGNAYSEALANNKNYVDLNVSTFSNVFKNKEEQIKRNPIRKDNKKNEISKPSINDKKAIKFAEINLNFISSTKYKNNSSLDMGTLKTKQTASVIAITPSSKKRFDYNKSLMNSTIANTSSSYSKKKNIKLLSLSEENFFKK